MYKNKMSLSQAKLFGAGKNIAQKVYARSATLAIFKDIYLPIGVEVTWEKIAEYLTRSSYLSLEGHNMWNIDKVKRFVQKGEKYSLFELYITESEIFKYRNPYDDNENELKIIELNPNDYNRKKVDLALVNHARENGYLEPVRDLLRNKQYDHNLCSAHLNADDWESVCICDDCCQKFLDEDF